MIMMIFAAISAGSMFAIEVPAAVYAGRYHYYYNNNYYSSYNLYYTRSNKQVICNLCFCISSFLRLLLS